MTTETWKAVAAGMPEAELQDAVIECAQRLGWTVAHFRPARTKDGWRTPVAADGTGYPDLHLVRGERSLFAELKSMHGRIRADQLRWLERLDEAGHETAIWTPTHWLSGEIEEALR